MIGSLSAAVQSRSNPCNWKQRFRRQESGHVHIRWKSIWPCFPWNILKMIYSGDTPLTFVQLIAADNTFQQPADVCSSDSTLTFFIPNLDFPCWKCCRQQKTFLYSVFGFGRGRRARALCVFSFWFLPKKWNRKGQQGLCLNIFPTFPQLQPLKKPTHMNKTAHKICLHLDKLTVHPRCLFHVERDYTSGLISCWCLSWLIRS